MHVQPGEGRNDASIRSRPQIDGIDPLGYPSLLSDANTHLSTKWLVLGMVLVGRSICVNSSEWQGYVLASQEWYTVCPTGYHRSYLVRLSTAKK